MSNGISFKTEELAEALVEKCREMMCPPVRCEGCVYNAKLLVKGRGIGCMFDPEPYMWDLHGLNPNTQLSLF